jgi:ATP-dependent RNA helicase SUPV3L1/SUV3
VLSGLGWGAARPELVESALEPHVPLPGGYRGYRVVDEARIRPQLSDLGVEDPLHVDAALVAWHRVALREWAHESWLAVESLQPLRLRLQAVQRRLAERGRRLSLEETWKLVNAPVDEDGLELLATLALAITGDRVARPHLTFLLDTARLRGASLEDAEEAGRQASILRWFALQYPGVGGVTIERAAALEEAAAARVVARLRVEVESPTIGRCRSCGRSCAPWFPLCERCAGIASRA